MCSEPLGRCAQGQGLRLTDGEGLPHRWLCCLYSTSMEIRSLVVRARGSTCINFLPSTGPRADVRHASQSLTGTCEPVAPTRLRLCWGRSEPSCAFLNWTSVPYALLPPPTPGCVMQNQTPGRSSVYLAGYAIYLSVLSPGFTEVFFWWYTAGILHVTWLDTNRLERQSIVKRHRLPRMVQKLRPLNLNSQSRVF